MILHPEETTEDFYETHRQRKTRNTETHRGRQAPPGQIPFSPFRRHARGGPHLERQDQ